MAVSYVGVNNAAGQNAGSTTTATAAITPTMPAGAASGDRIFVVQCTTGATATTPTSWTALAKDTAIASSLGAAASGAGQRFMSIYYRDYDGVWTMPSFAMTSQSVPSHWIGAIAVRRTNSSYNFDTPTVSSVASDVGTANTAHSATTASAFTTTSGGFLIVGTVLNDLATSSSPSLTQTGATFGTVTERADGGTSTGNDVSGQVHTCSVTTGATATITVAQTLSAASQGGNLIVQQTETLPKVATLTDNFNSYDTVKWTTTGAATVTGGRLQMGFVTGTQDKYDTDAQYDLTGSAMSMRVALSAMTSGAQIGMRFFDAAFTHYLELSVLDGTTLRFNQDATPISTLTYDPVAHRYWRIRESGGTGYFDTSVDGATWTNRQSTAVAGNYSNGWVQIISQRNSGTDGGNAYVDDFNCCPLAETLTDDFTTKDTAKWLWSGGADVSNGQAALTLVTGSEEIDSVTRSYDLTSSAMLVEVASVVSGGRAWLVFDTSAVNPNSYMAVFTDASGNLIFRELVANSASDTSVTYNAVTHRWWRIRESGGTIFWDTSPDGLVWTNQRSKSAGQTYTAGAPQLYVDTAAGTYLFDNFNIPGIAAPSNTGQFFAMF